MNVNIAIAIGLGGSCLLIAINVLMLWRLGCQMRVMEGRSTPFWAVLQQQMSESLHDPHPESQELDRYLEKLESLHITKEETEKLKSLLQAKVRDRNQSGKERSRAELLLFTMPRVIQERADAAALVALTKRKLK